MKLGDVVTFQSGITFPKNLQGKKYGLVPFAKVGDISRIGRSKFKEISAADNYVDEIEIAALKRKPIPAGSILFAKIGEAIKQNHRVISTCEMFIDNNAMAAIPDSSQIDTDYLYWTLKEIDFYHLASATTVPSIRKSVLENLEIYVPTISEQRNISEAKNLQLAIDQKRERQRELFEEFENAIFHEQIHNIPWDTPLGEIADIQIGPFGSALHKSDYIVGGVPVINPMHIIGSEIIPNDNFTISQEKSNSLKNYIALPGDIILARRGEMGRAGLVKDSHGQILCGTGSILIRPKDISKSIYIHKLLGSEKMRRILLDNSTGSTMPSINAEKLKKISIPNP